MFSKNKNKCLLMAAMLFVVACGKQGDESSGSTFEMPEVNNENCAAIKNLPDVPERKDFASKCLRRSVNKPFKKSEPKAWNP